MANFLTMDDYDFKNKTVLIRVDFNSPIDANKKITDDTRIRAHAPTIEELIEKGAKVVILAHQGRPGNPDFSTLEQHAKILGRVLGKPVKYVDDIYDNKAQTAIKELKSSEVLVLENVRMWREETAKKTAKEFSKTSLVMNLAPLADVYVSDGFAVAHRANGSIIGFPEVMPAVAGRLMERELNALTRAKDAVERPCIYLMGGAKAEDAAAISDYVLSNNKADYVLTGGVIAHLFLYAKGTNIGEPNVKYLEDKQFLQYIPHIKDLYKRFNGKIKTPEDFGVDIKGERRNITLADLPTKYQIFDIGPTTVKTYSTILKDAKIVVLSGPMGVYERSEFIDGTKGVFAAVAKNSAFSIAGGGNTIEAIEKLGLTKNISYISTGGGALMEFLTGKTLPGVEALIKAAR